MEIDGTNIEALTNADRRKIRALLRMFTGADSVDVGGGVLELGHREGWSFEKASRAVHFALAEHSDLDETPFAVRGNDAEIIVTGGQGRESLDMAQAWEAWKWWLIVWGVIGLVALGTVIFA